MGKRAAYIFSRKFTVSIISDGDITDEVVPTGAALADNPDEEISRAYFIFLTVPVNEIGFWVSHINDHSLPHCVIIDSCVAGIEAEKELSKIQRKRFTITEFKPGVTPVIGTPDKRIADFLKKQGCILRPKTAQG